MRTTKIRKINKEATKEGKNKRRKDSRKGARMHEGRKYYQNNFNTVMMIIIMIEIIIRRKGNKRITSFINSEREGDFKMQKLFMFDSREDRKSVV